MDGWPQLAGMIIKPSVIPCRQTAVQPISRLESRATCTKSCRQPKLHDMSIKTYNT